MALVQRSLPLQPLLERLTNESITPVAGTLLYVLWKLLHENKGVDFSKSVTILRKFLESLPHSAERDEKESKIKINSDREGKISKFLLSKKGFQNFVNILTKRKNFAPTFFKRIDDLKNDIFVRGTNATPEMKNRWKVISNIYNLENYLNPKRGIEYPIMEKNEEVTEKNNMRSKL